MNWTVFSPASPIKKRMIRTPGKTGMHRMYCIAEIPNWIAEIQNWIAEIPYWIALAIGKHALFNEHVYWTEIA